jgi:hypothetical protein
VLQAIGGGPEELGEYVELVRVDGLIEQVQSLFELMELAIRDGRSISEISEQLKQTGIGDADLREALLDTMAPFAELYISAACLRDCDDMRFQHIIRTMVHEVYVTRKHRQPASLQASLQLEDIDEAVNLLWIIKILLGTLFEQNASYEDVSSFMVNELNLSERKAALLLEIVHDNRDRLEMYFLFEQLRTLRLALEERDAVRD